MKSELIAIIADFLGVAPDKLADYQTLDDLGIDSLTLYEIMFEVEEKFDVPLISFMQRHQDEIHNLGDILRLSEHLIVTHKAAEPARTDG